MNSGDGGNVWVDKWKLSDASEDTGAHIDELFMIVQEQLAQHKGKGHSMIEVWIEVYIVAIDAAHSAAVASKNHRTIEVWIEEHRATTDAAFSGAATASKDGLKPHHIHWSEERPRRQQV